VKHWPGTLFSVFATVLMSSGPAISHQADTGWIYPAECCSEKDCRAVSAEKISESPDGFVIGPTGEAIGYSDRRVRDSPDGEYHWCSVGGKDDGRTICLFVPHTLS
jgi:hypothetical protein